MIHENQYLVVGSQCFAFRIYFFLHAQRPVPSGMKTCRVNIVGFFAVVLVRLPHDLATRNATSFILNLPH